MDDLQCLMCKYHVDASFVIHIMSNVVFYLASSSEFDVDLFWISILNNCSDNQSLFG